MRCLAIGALVLLTGCASHQTLERHALRADTFRAILAEQLTVSLDDVVVLPRDSVSPAIAARRATISRTAEAEVAATYESTLDTTAEDEAMPVAPWRPPLWSVLTIAAVIILLLKTDRSGD